MRFQKKLQINTPYKSEIFTKFPLGGIEFVIIIFDLK